MNTEHEQPAPNFPTELRNLLNRFSQENQSDTPDFILARYLEGCLNNFNFTVRTREEWYGRAAKCNHPLPAKLAHALDEAETHKSGARLSDYADEIRALSSPNNVLGSTQ